MPFATTLMYYHRRTEYENRLAFYRNIPVSEVNLHFQAVTLKKGLY